MKDVRHTPRQRVLKAGSIEFGGGAIDCVVRNLSPTGAAIEVESQAGGDGEFTSRRVSSRWRILAMMTLTLIRLPLQN